MRRMSPAEFNTAMIHFYRGEVQRSNTWRNRLDTTTNWAVITAGATLSFVFSSPNNPHFVIPINSILVAIFLLMEARRYRYYEIWSSRVRILETGYFATILTPENRPADEAWAEHLAAEQDAAQVDVDDLIELLCRDLHHGDDLRRSRVVDDRIDCAPAFEQRIARCFKVRFR